MTDERCGIGVGPVENGNALDTEMQHRVDGGPRHTAGPDDKPATGRPHGVGGREASSNACPNAYPVRVVSIKSSHRARAISAVEKEAVLRDAPIFTKRANWNQGVHSTCFFFS